MGILTVPTANTVQSEVPTLIGAEPLALQQLAVIVGQIHQMTRQAEVRVLTSDRNQMGMRPEAGSWCVSECLEHLSQTTRAFVPAITQAITEAPKLSGNRRLRTGTLADLLIRTLNPPYRLRFTVLPQLTPQNLDIETAWTSFVESQSQLSAMVLSATGLAIDKVFIKSPVYTRINYNIYAAFRMLVAHQSRHIWQMEQILKALDSRAVSGLA